MKANVETKECPILFSGEMVRAILEGRKTQTRRVISRKHLWPIRENVSDAEREADLRAVLDFCPYGKPGDRLWVRETWTIKFNDQGYQVYNAKGDQDATCCHYAADGYEVLKSDGDGGVEYRKDGTIASPWSPSIHMPRWASRITLEVTNVRVERLQDISEDDAEAEGIEGMDVSSGADDYQDYWRNYLDESDDWPWFSGDQIASYRSLWNSINGKKHPWESNPWVWVIEFQKVRQRDL